MAKQRLTADWLWCQLMDYSMKIGISPAENPALFAIVDAARELERTADEPKSLLYGSSDKIAEIRATLEDMRRHGLTAGLPQDEAFILLAEIDRLRAAHEPSGWQPIESAPIDENVLLYSPWRHLTNPERIEIDYAKNSRAGSAHAWATHWMPVPMPPQTTEETTGSRDDG